MLKGRMASLKDKYFEPEVSDKPVEVSEVEEVLTESKKTKRSVKKSKLKK